MAENISEQGVRKAIAEVRHPVINCTLVDLGIIKDVTIGGDKVVVTVAFPGPNIPIKNTLVNSIKGPLARLGVECEIKETIMNSEERKIFLDKSKTGEISRQLNKWTEK